MAHGHILEFLMITLLQILLHKQAKLLKITPQIKLDLVINNSFLHIIKQDEI